MKQGREEQQQYITENRSCDEDNNDDDDDEDNNDDDDDEDDDDMRMVSTCEQHPCTATRTTHGRTDMNDRWLIHSLHSQTGGSVINAIGRDTDITGEPSHIH